MTAFTDDDLKQLKEAPHVQAYACGVEEDGEHRGSVDVLDRKKFRALLARLETAENYIAHSHGPASSRCCEKAKELDRAWRKAAGK